METKKFPSFFIYRRNAPIVNNGVIKISSAIQFFELANKFVETRKIVKNKICINNVKIENKASKTGKRSERKR